MAPAQVKRSVRGCARGKTQEAGRGHREAVGSPVCGAAGRGRWPVAGGQTGWHPVRAQGTGRHTRPDACDGGGAPVRARRRRCHTRCTSRGTRQQAHAPRPGEGGVRARCGGLTRHDIRSPRRGHGRPSAARATGHRQQVGCGACASGGPRAAGHGGGLASPRRVGGIRVCHPGRVRHVAVRRCATPEGPTGGVGGPAAGRRPQQATPARCAGRAAPPAARRAQGRGAWGVRCHTDASQEVVHAAVVVGACADQSVL